ncbi:hypothetical protein [Mycobacterium sp. 94-17]|nr:hypothetical protein [Mycobacterium sp. 94-17]MEB4210895.1 hypothetical protein [Mycobacterium sp. 94-17]
MSNKKLVPLVLAGLAVVIAGAITFVVTMSGPSRQAPAGTNLATTIRR